MQRSGRRRRDSRAPRAKGPRKGDQSAEVGTPDTSDLLSQRGRLQLGDWIPLLGPVGKAKAVDYKGCQAPSASRGHQNLRA